ncbi:murein DD-endopeptidase MepS/Murein LD-carboxypeptidase [Lachnospiraceae bacterium]|nr:murein DD-endopeptidase MepS/Murein LD-carboxypeptidase [Lachnospiraceae bacterium]
MNKYGVKAAACALVGTLSLSGYQTTLEAKIHGSSDVPAAGVAVVMDEGSTIQDLQVEVVQNIAYLESASGLQPNIVLASEKVGLAEAVNNIVQSNPNLATTKTSLENGQESTTVIDVEESEQQGISEQEGEEQESLHSEESEERSEEEASSIEQETSTQETSEQETSQEKSSTEETSEQETSTEETSQEKPSTEETSEQETTNTEEETTEESTDIEDDFQISAGFSATDTYDNVELIEEETETQTDEQDFSGLVIARVTNYVNVRSLPSEESEIVGKLYDKSVGEFIEEKDGWYKIVSGNCTGYVKGEYCVVGEEAEALAKEVGTTYAVVNTTTLKVRKEASTESSVLGLVPIEEELIVVEELDGWVKIAIEEGDGYVSRDYVNLRTDFVHAESREEEEARLAKEARAREEARAAAAATEATRTQKKAEAQVQKSEANQATIEAARNTAASSGGSEMGKAVIDYATQFVGNPYVYGGSSLTNGTDCSGFVMSVYANFGVSLPHSSSALRSRGYDVGGLQNAQPGDIVCYSGHVGLYVGNGQIVHASTSKTGIIVSSATYRNILTVRRIF